MRPIGIATRNATAAVREFSPQARVGVVSRGKRGKCDGVALQGKQGQASPARWTEMTLRRGLLQLTMVGNSLTLEMMACRC